MIIAKIDMAAATLAHRGLGRDRHVELRAATETADAPQFTLRFDDLVGRCLSKVGEPEILPALFADRGISCRRLQLSVSALRTSDGHFRRFHAAFL